MWHRYIALQNDKRGISHSQHCSMGSVAASHEKSKTKEKRKIETEEQVRVKVNLAFIPCWIDEK